MTTKRPIDLPSPNLSFLQELFEEMLGVWRSGDVDAVIKRLLELKPPEAALAAIYLNDRLDIEARQVLVQKLAEEAA